MTDNEIRIAIAEICHWEVHHGGKYCSIPNCENPCLKGRLFDPLEDLNAMHEAEEWLLKKSQSQPTDVLWSRYSAYLDGVGICIKFHATARHRAEDFLRTIGKWVE